MVSVVRYICGYVKFRAEGGFPERFLNLCKTNDISLWDVKNDGVKVEACTSAREFASIEKPAKNSGMTIKTLENKGFPFWAKRHKWRCGVLLGAFFAVCLVWYMSGFVWEVEIVEEDGVKINNFTQTLEKIGVRPGVRKSKINIQSVQEELLRIYPELSWVSLNIFGDKAQIEYTPSNPAPEVIDTKTPSNIVASKSGRITLVEGYAGTNQIKEGAFVSEGSLLISGVTQNADGTERMVRARGKVFAQTENVFTSQLKCDNKIKIAVNPEIRYKLCLFGLDIPLGFKPDGELITYTEIPLVVDSTILPVGIIRDEGISLSEVDGEYTSQEAYMLNFLYCINEKRLGYSDAEITKINFAPNESPEQKGLTMEIVCIENIALEKAVYIE